MSSVPITPALWKLEQENFAEYANPAYATEQDLAHPQKIKQTTHLELICPHLNTQRIPKHAILFLNGTSAS